MVYCGKPSTACRQCRRRNIKCDKKRDSCGQCVRGGFSCPGYRDPAQLIIRDETQAVVRKSRKCDASIIPLPRSVSLQEVDMLAKELFISQYVFGDTPKFEYLTHFYPPILGENDHLFFVFKAVCLAYFANYFSAPSALQSARLNYSKALRLTNKLLQSPIPTTDDTIFMTVLLFDLFEKWANRDSFILKTENTHVNGAKILAQLRGGGQFHDHIGVRMFLQLKSTVFLDCLQRQCVVPEEFVALWRRASGSAATLSLECDLSKLLFRFVNLRASASDTHTSDGDVMATATDLDDDVSQLLSVAPLPWTIETASNSHGHHCQVVPAWYQSPHQARATLSLIRLLLHHTIRTYSSKLTNLDTQARCIELSVSDAVIDSLSSEILMTTSQFIASPHRQSHQQHSKVWSPSQLIYASSLVFPLSIIYHLAPSSATIRQTVLSQLQFLGSAMRVREAVTVQHRLQKGDTRIFWALWNI